MKNTRLMIALFLTLLITLPVKAVDDFADHFDGLSGIAPSSYWSIEQGNPTLNGQGQLILIATDPNHWDSVASTVGQGSFVADFSYNPAVMDTTYTNMGLWGSHAYYRVTDPTTNEYVQVHIQGDRYISTPYWIVYASSSVDPTEVYDSAWQFPSPLAYDIRVIWNEALKKFDVYFGRKGEFLALRKSFSGFSASSASRYSQFWTAAAGIADDANVALDYYHLSSGTKGSPVKVVEWNMDEGANAIAHDTSGSYPTISGWVENGNNGTLSGATWVQGLAGNCVNFDGSGDTIVNTSASKLPVNASDPWSINMYVYLNADANDVFIGGFGDDTITTAGVNRYVYNWAGISFWNGGSAKLITGVPFSIGKWQMITMTYDGTTTKVYKDGALIGSSTSFVYNLAASQVKLSPKSNFNGKIDAFTVWSGALLQGDVSHLVRLMPVTGNLNSDRKVDMLDLRILIDNWLYPTD